MPKLPKADPLVPKKEDPLAPDEEPRSELQSHLPSTNERLSEFFQKRADEGYPARSELSQAERLIEGKQPIAERPTMSDPTREETDAKIAAGEARTDTKFAQLDVKFAQMDGKLNLVLSKVDEMKSRFDARFDDVRSGQRAIVANIWVVGFGLGILIVAVFALFPAFFSMGEHFLVDAASHK
jgi:hypothetical protein